MPRPLVIGYHLIWTAYGYWLPNDPRGSGSKLVRSSQIAKLGELHYGRKRIQPAGKDIEQFYNQAKSVLRYPVLEFDRAAVSCIATAFGETIGKRPYTCYACAIMPDHVHLIIRKHKDTAEDMIANLQKHSCQALGALGFGGDGHPIWTHGGWQVFLDCPDDVRRTIRYIENNPIAEGLARHCWEFVKEYDGWPLHPGHDPNSPWARRLRRT
jgi:REP element-mobilizing transposase RayT